MPANAESTQPAMNETDNDESIVTLDRRTQGKERRSDDAAVSDDASMENPRRKKQRRRHIDPTTCERDYSDPEIEFMRAMDDYKRKSGRMFPTCSEVLEVVRDLGYVRLTGEQREILALDEFEDEDELESFEDSSEFEEDEVEV